MPSVDQSGLLAFSRLPAGHARLHGIPTDMYNFDISTTYHVCVSYK